MKARLRTPTSSRTMPFASTSYPVDHALREAWEARYPAMDRSATSARSDGRVAAIAGVGGTWLWCSSARWKQLPGHSESQSAWCSGERYVRTSHWKDRTDVATARQLQERTPMLWPQTFQQLAALQNGMLNRNSMSLQAISASSERTMRRRRLTSGGRWTTWRRSSGRRLKNWESIFHPGQYHFAAGSLPARHEYPPPRLRLEAAAG